MPFLSDSQQREHTRVSVINPTSASVMSNQIPVLAGISCNSASIRSAVAGIANLTGSSGGRLLR